MKMPKKLLNVWNSESSESWVRLELVIKGLQRTLAVEAMCPSVGPGPLAFIKSACVLAFDPGARSVITNTVAKVAQAARHFL